MDNNDDLELTETGAADVAAILDVLEDRGINPHAWVRGMSPSMGTKLEPIFGTTNDGVDHDFRAAFLLVMAGYGRKDSLT